MAAEWQCIDTAPKDGTVIRVLHGRQQTSVLARWQPLFQGWVQADEGRTILHRVTSWRDRKEGE